MSHEFDDMNSFSRLSNELSPKKCTFSHSPVVLIQTSLSVISPLQYDGSEWRVLHVVLTACLFRNIVPVTPSEQPASRSRAGFEGVNCL